MSKKPGKLHQKAIDIAKSQVIKTKSHSYCPAVYYNHPSAKFVVAMELEEQGGFCVCYMTQYHSPQWGGSEVRKTLLEADADLVRMAKRTKGEIFEKKNDGFDLYDERLADEGKPPQNPNQTMAVVKAAPAQISHVGYLDEQFIADYEEEVAQFGAKSKEFAELTLRIGLRLEFVKSQLKHGQLNKWIEKHGRLSTSHAHRCRKLAQVFIKAQQIGDDEMFALVDPENSKEALIKKLEQLAFDFIGEDSQAELFAKYGIQVREPKPLGGKRENKPLDVPLEKQREFARESATEFILDIHQLFLDPATSKLPLLDLPMLRALQEKLQSASNETKVLIKAG